jgi:hypothetical protein
MARSIPVRRYRKRINGKTITVDKHTRRVDTEPKARKIQRLAGVDVAMIEKYDPFYYHKTPGNDVVVMWQEKNITPDGIKVFYERMTFKSISEARIFEKWLRNDPETIKSTIKVITR